jgi:signal transduction histidine kinase
MNPSRRGNPHIPQPRREGWPNARSAGDSANSPAVLADAQPATIVEARQRRHQVGTVWRPGRTTRDGLIEALTALSGRCRALTARKRELASEVKQLRAERCQLRSRMAAAGNVQPVASRPVRAHTYLASVDERRRLERDLHDGVQNEIVAVIVKLQHAAEDRHTPPELAGTLCAIAARAEAALDAVREIAHGIYPPALAAFGVEPALRAQSRPASIDVSVLGTAPRSTDDAEVAACFSSSEAIQNVAKHAGRAAHARRLNYDRGILAVCIQDDGRGFDTAHTEERTDLRNIRERIQTLGGTVELNSNPGRGTLLTFSLPWPPRSPQTDRAPARRPRAGDGPRAAARRGGRGIDRGAGAGQQRGSADLGEHMGCAVRLCRAPVRWSVGGRRPDPCSGVGGRAGSGRTHKGRGPRC